MTLTQSARRQRPTVEPTKVRRRALLADQSGVAAVEYAILAAGIAATLVVALTRLGHSVEGNWNEVNTAVQGPTYNTN